MSREGHIYKLYCDGVDEFYIGSTWDMKQRKWKHKSKCYNINAKEYKLKVYQYIRANSGFSNWKFEILETALFENKTSLLIREQHYKNSLNPSLNDRNAYQSKEERQIYMEAHDKKRRQTKINCPCGGKTNEIDKYKHMRTDKHQKYLQNITIHNLQNLTININIQ